MLLKPDIDFIRHIRKDSGSALSACMQCGSCTSVCSLAGADNPFPRKEMKWAAWGMKDKLTGHPDLWLCHQCGDCTTTCPRGVRPGEVIASLRKYNYAFYSRPAFLYRWMSRPAFLPLLVLIPALVILLILVLAGTLTPPAGTVRYSEFFPHAWLNGSFSILVIFFAAGLVTGARKFWADMKRLRPAPITKSLISIIPAVARDILLHKKFGQCKENRHRRLSHLLVLWGFVMLLAVTLFAILASVFFTYPLPFLHPAKILGNLAGTMLCTGCLLLMWKRLVAKDGTYHDWFFLITLFLLGLSGFFVEAARYGNWHGAYLIYFIHLILVWLVIMYFPYTKFVHICYRLLAILYTESTKTKDTGR